MSRVAVITPVHRRHRHLQGQWRSLAGGEEGPDDYVVVAMDDPGLAGWDPGDPRPRVIEVPTDPRGLPLAAARNAGAAAALERGAEVLIFLDVDCLAAPGLIAGYREAVLAAPGTVWSGPVTYLPPAPPEGYRLADLVDWDDPHPARPAPRPGELSRQRDPDLFWSLSFALHRRAWQAAGGFCEEYAGYGGEDTDFARVALAAGLELGWTGSARAYHQHHVVEDPPVRHLDDILRNAAVFHRRWGSWPMRGWLEAFAASGLITRDATGWSRCRSTRPRPPAADR